MTQIQMIWAVNNHEYALLAYQCPFGGNIARVDISQLYD